MSKLSDAMSACREAEVMECVERGIAAGETAESLVAECNVGLVDLGNRFDCGEAFIPDLMFGGMIMKKVMKVLESHLKPQDAAAAAVIVLGTVQHDVHDIGKDIAAMVFRAAGYRVIDLGVDVPPVKFAAAIAEHKPRFVGMSLLLTTCYKSVSETIAAISEAGLRDGVRILVGGAAASELMAERTGCDFYAKTAIDGLRWADSVKS
ncbi:MAG: cobalamin B12-binding domain-containing protein [Thermoguttaceae bacterium]